MKKYMSIMLVMILLLLSACSKNTTANDQISGDKKHPTGTITVWGWDVAAATMKAAVDRFQKKYPDVKVKVEDFNSSDLYDKLTVGLAARGSGLPDVVLMEDERIPGYVHQFPEGFLKLNKLGYGKYKDSFNQAKVAAVQNKAGDFIAAPWDIGPAGVFYRVDYFKKANVDPNSIKTWDDYIAAGKKIKDATGAKLLPIDIPNYDGVFQMMMQQQGLSYFDKDGKITLQSKEAIRAMNVIKKLHDEDLVLNNKGWDGIVTATVNGSVATVPYGVWYAGSIMDQAPNLKGKWDVFYLPSFESGGSRYANVGGSSLLIPSTSTNQSAAYAFVEFFTTDKKSQLLGFEKYGLFPSLKETYSAPQFSQNNEYFNNSPIFKKFADIVDQVPKIKLNENYAKASSLTSNAQASILLENKSVESALKDAQKQLENEIK
ncbi:ABC transporter substrate-binding protein [Neobacillus ginsengisoli]|uniref:Lactose/L-arabinose transport system substrate-binding protein n=1 Tax=Neobacillus ginsengisoli TaxID=904295 RepID=A0ABT9XT07_9BACI|nr:sugar ABC transporter substrate-binding protein [Neobacillus ginsengisoli]MDQ0198697.1 lactose/L-arabinose transport system substrate-binding protein [Neobacillus ginsengisoli]